MNLQRKCGGAATPREAFGFRVVGDKPVCPPRTGSLRRRFEAAGFVLYGWTEQEWATLPESERPDEAFPFGVYWLVIVPCDQSGDSA